MNIGDAFDRSSIRLPPQESGSPLDKLKESAETAVKIGEACVDGVVDTGKRAAASALQVTLAGGAMWADVVKLGVGVASYAISAELVNAQREVQELKSQLAKVDVSIKALMQAIEKKRSEEEGVKDDIEQRQDAQQRVMENLKKAADSLATMRDSLFG